MKECGLSLLGGMLKCSDLDGNQCLAAQNEGVPGGDLDKVREYCNSQSKEAVGHMLKIIQTSPVMADCAERHTIIEVLETHLQT